MRPRFWYCPLCGYMFFETAGPAAAVGTIERDCPLCGGEAVPCWECIAAGVFDSSLCSGCGRAAECRAASGAGRQ